MVVMVVVGGANGLIIKEGYVLDNCKDASKCLLCNSSNARLRSSVTRESRGPNQITKNINNSFQIRDKYKIKKGL